MAQYIADALGIEPEVHIEPSHVGEVTHYVANIGKARALLDYTPTTSLKDGLQKAVAWSLDWWEKHPTSFGNQ
jgi:UDP-glucose 4-epimerase